MKWFRAHEMDWCFVWRIWRLAFARPALPGFHTTYIWGFKHLFWRFWWRWDEERSSSIVQRAKRS